MTSALFLPNLKSITLDLGDLEYSKPRSPWVNSTLPLANEHSCTAPICPLLGSLCPSELIIKNERLVTEDRPVLNITKLKGHTLKKVLIVEDPSETGMYSFYWRLAGTCDPPEPIDDLFVVFQSSRGAQIRRRELSELRDPYRYFLPTALFRKKLCHTIALAATRLKYRRITICNAGSLDPTTLGIDETDRSAIQRKCEEGARQAISVREYCSVGERKAGLEKLRFMSMEDYLAENDWAGALDEEVAKSWLDVKYSNKVQRTFVRV